MWKMTIAALSLFTLASVCLAGPNVDGVLLVSVNELLSYEHGETYCGLTGLDTCLEADARVDDGTIHVFHVLAAFPDACRPEVNEVLFGIRYTPTITIVDRGSCGVWELPTTSWPTSGEGTAVVWDEPYETGHLFEIYWFAGYVEAGSTGTFEVGPHPDPVFGGLGWFVAPPPLEDMDPIIDYGRLGFGADGYVPCPDPVVPTDLNSWGKIKVRFGR